MTSEVKRRPREISSVASYDGGGENTLAVTPLGLYWGKTNRPKQVIPHSRVVCVKSKRGAEGSCEGDVHHKNATTKVAQNFGAAKHFVRRNSEGESESKIYTDIQ